MSVHLAVNKRKGRIIINEITSMYGKDDEPGFAHSSIETGNLVYMDKKRTEEWEKKISLAWKRESWVQFPGRRPPELQGYVDSIFQKRDLSTLHNYQLDNTQWHNKKSKP